MAIIADVTLKKVYENTKRLKMFKLLQPKFKS